MWGHYVVGFVFPKAVGASRGIIVMWDKNTFNLVFFSQGKFSITSILQTVEGGFTWVFTGIYGAQARLDKLRFWKELQSTKDGWPDPWCWEPSMKFCTLKKEA